MTIDAAASRLDQFLQKMLIAAKDVRKQDQAMSCFYALCSVLNVRLFLSD